MRYVLAAVFFLALFGCSTCPVATESRNVAQPCLGSTDLPASLAGQFEPIDDEQLLSRALGAPLEGKLCQGQVYKSKAGSRVTLYRAWNSTNPHSQFGKWWAFHKPAGRVSAYRSDYEICYQWSPLDKLMQCTLKPDTPVVVGTGQSAECSEYLTYPASEKQQIYIEDGSAAFSECTVFDCEFSWK